MGKKFRQVEFKISRKTLWIGAQVYPLSQITSVEVAEVRLDRAALTVRYSRMIVAWCVLGLLGVCVHGVLPVGVRLVGGLIVAVALASLVARLVRRLISPGLFMLQVYTAGPPRALLVSKNEPLLRDLAGRVVDAINDPAMEYAIRVDHVDLISGDKYGGDKVSGDKILIRD